MNSQSTKLLSIRFSKKPISLFPIVLVIYFWLWSIIYYSPYWFPNSHCTIFQIKPLLPQLWSVIKGQFRKTFNKNLLRKKKGQFSSGYPSIWCLPFLININNLFHFKAVRYSKLLLYLCPNSPSLNGLYFHLFCN